MRFSQITSLVSFAAAALAAPTSKCKAVTPTLPSTGSTDLAAPSANLSVKYIAVGHGIQNYTCANTSANAVNTGALAVLYDITPLYPGTPNTGLSAAAFQNISSAVLRNQAIPLNLANAAAGKVAVGGAASLSEIDYQANTQDPFPSPAQDLSVEGISAKFLAHHYFDAKSSPTFDLSGGSNGLFFSGAKSGDVKAPSSADTGLLTTGAVDWLQLSDNGRGLSSGVSVAYRVVTAGGVAQACSVSGANPTGQVFSVPYTAQYWFYE